MRARSWKDSILSNRLHIYYSDFDTNFWMEAVDDVLIVAVTDANGTILHANSKFCDISGYSKSELIGNNHRILNSATHDAVFFADMFRTIGSGNVWRGEICNRSKSGALYWVDTTIIPYFDPSGLITRYVACRFDITEQKMAQQRLNTLLSTDQLTGLLSRSGYLETVNNTLGICDTEKDCLSVAILGIDNFKDVNDIYGYDAGDEVIRIVARRLEQEIGDANIVARLGGDEFAFLFGPKPKQLLDDTRKRLSRALATIRLPVGLGITKKTISASIGVATFPDDGSCSSTLIRNADIALHTAKSRGKDRLEMFVPEMLENTSRRVELHDQAFAGLKRGEFELFYQPIIDLTNGNLSGFEALLRWRHPVFGLIAPGRFPEVLANHRLSAMIGLFVQGSAIKQAARWKRDGISFGKIAINTTTADFATPKFAEKLLARLRRHGLETCDLCVEVTEGMFLGKRGVAVHRELSRLHQAGVDIAFDDFGTGYASLTHLKELPINCIKIDRSFIMEVTENPNDRKIVKSIIKLAHDLGLTTTAEGIETEEQRALLVKLGCDRIQGYLISRPLPAPEISDFSRYLASSFEINP